MKRLLGTAVMILMVAGALAACGSETTTTLPVSTSGGEQSSTTQVSSTTPVSGGGSTSAEVVELSVGASGPLLGVQKAFWYDFVQAELEKSGQVKLNIFESSTTAKSEWDALLSGRFDIMFGYFSDYEGLFPISQILSLPMLFPAGTTDQFGQPVGYVWPVWADLYAKYPEIQQEFKDVHFLCVLIGGGGNIWTQEPINSLGDLEGLKLRAGSVMDGKALEALGVTPVTMSPTEIYSSIERKVIDGSCAAWGGAIAMKTHELCKNVYEVSLDHSTSFWVAMSQDAWERCSPEVQSMIEQMFAPENVITRVGSDIYYQDDAKGIETAKAGGVAVTSISAADLAQARELMKPLWDEWVKTVEAKGLPGTEILNDALKLVDQYSK